jgi:fatty-acyl-CoA synthase
MVTMRQRILVVDDDPSLAEMLTIVLRGEGFDTAVIGVPDEKWGERPKAFVVLKPGSTATQEELLDHVRGRIARFKAPREIEFVDALPKTSTGKTQKFTLREKEWAGQTSRIKG